MTRLRRAWGAIDSEQRLAAGAALALLVTMFFPWYGLQSVNRRTGAIYTHNISAFGDVSFVEAAIFLVCAGVLAMLFARAERRDFRLPGGDGTIVLAAGGWAALLIFYRVFDRPSSNNLPVGIQWGFFLAFVAAGALAYAGWRMRAHERPDPPARRSRVREAHERPDPPARRPRVREDAAETVASSDAAETVAAHAGRAAPGRAAPVRARERAPYPPAPGERGQAPQQLSFEDPPAGDR